MGCSYRRWKLDDLPSIRNVTWTTWVDAYAPFIPVADLEEYFGMHYAIGALDRLFHDPDVAGFVAERDGRVVGYLKTKFVPAERRLYISSVYVLPGEQGKGIGGGLMSLAEDEARHRGVGECWLGVMSQNTKSLDWYLRLGFEFVEELPFTMGKTTVPHKIGRKLLGGASPDSAPRSSGEEVLL